jgi:hypothetical protein
VQRRKPARKHHVKDASSAADALMKRHPDFCKDTIASGFEEKRPKME